MENRKHENMEKSDNEIMWKKAKEQSCLDRIMPDMVTCICRLIAIPRKKEEVEYRRTNKQTKREREREREHE